MKNQVRIILVAAIIGVLAWSCSKTTGTEESTTLKLAINQSASSLNTAMNAISATNAFRIFTVNDGSLKSGSLTTYNVNIPLENIKGVYNYQPVTTNTFGTPLIRYFNKTAVNNQMVVNLPLKKIENIRSLRLYDPADAALTNNFSIAVSDYHNNYNSYSDYDYILASEISVDNIVSGNLNIKSIVSPENGKQYASQFSFKGGYTAKYVYESGETTVSSLAIMDGTKLLYKEELLSAKVEAGFFGSERTYNLTIGNVLISRKFSTNSIEISVNGVVQTKAVATIVDSVTEFEPSICRNRDIQITFEDGTSTTVSALIGKSISNITTLFDSLHQVYFAAYVVDWIAYDIYYQR